MTRLRSIAFALLWCAASAASAAGPTDPPSDKISPALARALERSADGRAEMLVVLAEQADLETAKRATGKTERGRRVFEALSGVARRTQRPLVDELERLGAPHREFWIANFVWSEGDAGLARRLAARPDVARIEANPRLRMPAPPPEEPSGPWLIAESPEAIEPNLTQVGAPDVWALGYTGLGVVVGGQDTGVQWDHPALQAHYRGWNGSIASHDYNWHDAIHDGDGDCGADAAEPCDDDDHGTHTVGTMVGDDSGTNRIGMAPGAQWIACRNMQEGVGTPASYTECFEWFVAPTDLDGKNPDPERAPHVINNSWSCPDSEGCDEVETELLRAVVENTRAAGIVVVVSAGNGGIGGCSTIVDPAAIYDASFTVGAVDSNDAPASFSSRGPVTVYDPDLMKPDISAPGVSVRSAIRGDNYASFSGTSMSAPHVAGLVALLLSADPSLAGDVDAIEATIRSTAAHPATSTQVCGGVSATVFPNNTFGAGRIDALAAVESLFAGGLIFRDGLELGGTARWSFVEP